MQVLNKSHEISSLQIDVEKNKVVRSAADISLKFDMHYMDLK